MNDRLGFRRAAADDVDTVAALTMAAYAKWLGVIDSRPKPMDADHARAVASHFVYLGCESGEAVALIDMVPEPGCMLIENVAVQPDK